MSRPIDRMDEALKDLSREYRADAAPARWERRVLAMFRPPKRDWGLWWMLAPAAVAAGLALLALRVPEAETLALRAWSPPVPEVKVAPRRVSLAAARAKKTLPVEIVSDFFPLRAGQVLAPGELGQVVRTRMARWEARRFGILWNEAGDGPDVPADILVGGDGSARAVRFVHTSMNR